MSNYRVVKTEHGFHIEKKGWLFWRVALWDIKIYIPTGKEINRNPFYFNTLEEAEDKIRSMSLREIYYPNDK